MEKKEVLREAMVVFFKSPVFRLISKSLQVDTVFNVIRMKSKNKFVKKRGAGGVLIKLCLNLLMGHSHEFLGTGCDRTRNWGRNSNQSVEYFFPGRTAENNLNQKAGKSNKNVKRRCL